MDVLATHGLSCQWSEGHHHCHAAINNFLQKALTAAKIPTRREPSGLYSPVSARMASLWSPGSVGHCWCACPDTLAPSYSASATSEVGAVAAQVEERKEAKYAHLNRVHSFYPVAFETSGVFGLGQCLERVTEKRGPPTSETLDGCLAWQFGISAGHHGSFRC